MQGMNHIIPTGQITDSYTHQLAQRIQEDTTKPYVKTKYLRYYSQRAAIFLNEGCVKQPDQKEVW